MPDHTSVHTNDVQTNRICCLKRSQSDDDTEEIKRDVENIEQKPPPIHRSTSCWYLRKTARGRFDETSSDRRLDSTQAISVGILERQMRQFWMEGVSTRWFEPEYRSGFVNSFSNNRPLVAQPLNLRNHEDLYYWIWFYGQAGPWVTRILTKRGYEMELWVYIQAFYDFNEKRLTFSILDRYVMVCFWPCFYECNHVRNPKDRWCYF